MFGEIQVKVDEAGPCIPEIMRKSFIDKISENYVVINPNQIPKVVLTVIQGLKVLMQKSMRNPKTCAIAIQFTSIGQYTV